MTKMKRSENVTEQENKFPVSWSANQNYHNTLAYFKFTI